MFGSVSGCCYRWKSLHCGLCVEFILSIEASCFKPLALMVAMKSLWVCIYKFWATSEAGGRDMGNVMELALLVHLCLTLRLL